MTTRRDKPREYFAKLLDSSKEEIDYSEIPPTTRADWENAEVILPITAEEFRRILRFIRYRRQRDTETLARAREGNSMRAALAALISGNLRAWSTSPSVMPMWGARPSVSTQSGEEAYRWLFSSSTLDDPRTANVLAAPNPPTVSENAAMAQKDTEIRQLRRTLLEQNSQIAERDRKIAMLEANRVIDLMRDTAQTLPDQMPVYRVSERPFPSFGVNQ